MSITTPNTILSCPSWCNGKHEDPDSIDGRIFWHHDSNDADWRVSSDVSVSLSIEQSVDTDGVHRGPIEITMFSGEVVDYNSVDAVLELADNLSRLAERIKEAMSEEDALLASLA